MVSKIASEAAKPRGLLEVRPGWEEGFLAGLSLSAIPGIGPKTVTRLAELGLSDVVEVQRRPLEDLERLLGPSARSLKRRAHGHGGSTLTGGGLPKSVSRESTLSRDSSDRERLERLLTLFTSRIASQLRSDGLMARTVTLKLRHGDFRTVTRQRTLPHATDLDHELREPIQWLFDKAFPEVLRRNKGVRLIGVGASNLMPAETPDLFEEPARTKQRELTSAVDRVRERFGFDAVTPASIVSMRRPRRDEEEREAGKPDEPS